MEKLVLLDGNSLLHKAFHAIKANLTDKDGNPTNAVYGFINMMLKIINSIKPTHLVAVFDVKAPTFRKELYDDYKATRKPMDESLAVQIPRLKELILAMKIKIVELAGYEADDLIGTIAKATDMQTYIVTGDRDSLQLVDDSTTVCYTKMGISDIQEVTPENIVESFGYNADQVIELKAMMGDSSDNIPGIRGVGEVTALKFLAKYGNIEGLYQHLDELKGKELEKVINGKEMAFLSRVLATIKIDCPINVEIDKYVFTPVFDQKVRNLLSELDFKSIISRMKFSEVAPDEKLVEAAPQVAVVKSVVSDGQSTQQNMFDNATDFQTKFVPILAKDCLIKDEAQLKDLINSLLAQKEIALFFGKNLHFAFDEGAGFEIAIKETLLDEGFDYQFVLEALKPVLESRGIKKICFDYKVFKRDLRASEIEVEGLGDDIMLLSYVFDATRIYKSIKEMFDAYYFDMGQSAAYLLQLRNYFVAQTVYEGTYKVYSEMEKPLIDVLLTMETAGFRVDKTAIGWLKSSFKQRIAELTTKIEAYAGESFNINSPKQLGVILFEKLGLFHGKKTKTGFSTDVDVLQSLVTQHEIIPLILDYREISKLLSTYVEGMEKCISSDGKIHTIFRQAVTATGRLSSTEPNLQNIPVRKKEGKELRKMFIASEGCQLVCADYSQIELRLLAHFSNDRTLCAAYANNDDIHSITASKVYDVDLSQVTKQMRGNAKAVNFGIIYGISDFGLSGDIGTSVIEARRFIEKYFATYPGVKQYMDNNVVFAKENGYIASIAGRKRKIAELGASNFSVRKFGERIAMNMPLQGSASDVVKVAMLRVDKALRDGGFAAKMIMQVHDELVIDTPTGEIEAVSKLLKHEMECAYKLKVSLIAEVGVGNNWLDAK